MATTVIVDCCGCSGVVEEEGTLSVSLASLDFGEVIVHMKSPTQILQIQNNSEHPVALGKLASYGDFLIHASPPNRLMPGSVVIVEVNFQPVGLGNASGYIEIASSSGNQTLQVDLTGVGVEEFVKEKPLLLDYWKESRKGWSIDTNASVWTPVSDLNNADAIIAPKGWGAILASQTGNQRGRYATDLQSLRTLPAQVASGIYSVIAGGRGNMASGHSSVVVGGQLNSAPGDNTGIVAGYENDTTGKLIFVGTGVSNVINGERTVVLSAENLTHTGKSSFIGSMDVGQASGDRVVMLTTTGGSRVDREGGVIISANNTVITLSPYSFIGTTHNGAINNSPSSFAGAGERLRILQSEHSAVVAGDDHLIDRSPDSFIGAGHDHEIVRSPSSHIGGGESNVINLSVNSFIGSGDNLVLDATDYSFIGAGLNLRVAYDLDADGFTQHIADSSALVGGKDNALLGSQSGFMGSGEGNTLQRAAYGTVVAGFNNKILFTLVGTVATTSDYSAILGGFTNLIRASKNSLIGSGRNNTVVGSDNAAIVMGNTNTITTSANSSILGGAGNTVLNSTYSSIIGGQTVEVTSSNWGGVLGGARHKLTSSNYGGIGFGVNHQVLSSEYGLILTGSDNYLSASSRAVILAGASNRVVSSPNGAVVSGSVNNVKDSPNGVVLTGSNNNVLGAESGMVVAGSQNQVTNDYAVVLNGQAVALSGKNSAAINGYNISDDGVASSLIRGDEVSFKNNLLFSYYQQPTIDVNGFYNSTLHTETPNTVGGADYPSARRTLFVPKNSFVRFDMDLIFSASIAQDNYHRFRINGSFRRQDGNLIIIQPPVVTHDIDIGEGTPTVVVEYDLANGLVFFRLKWFVDEGSVRWLGDMNAHYLMPTGLFDEIIIEPTDWYASEIRGGTSMLANLRTTYPNAFFSGKVQAFENLCNLNGFAGLYTSVSFPHTFTYLSTRQIVPTRITQLPLLDSILSYTLLDPPMTVEGERVIGMVLGGATSLSVLTSLAVAFSGTVTFGEESLTIRFRRAIYDNDNLVVISDGSPAFATLQSTKRDIIGMSSVGLNASTVYTFDGADNLSALAAFRSWAESYGSTNSGYLVQVQFEWNRESII